MSAGAHDAEGLGPGTGLLSASPPAPATALSLFGATLHRYRLAAGLTQEELAERAALSRRGLVYLEQGARRPFRDTVRRLAVALALPPDERAAFEALARQVSARSGGLASGAAPPAVPAAVPPLPPRAAQPHNLPVPLTSFVGRAREMAQVAQLLADARLLTLIGSGGVGKTRLALQVAAQQVAHYPDGVWLVELAPLADPALVPQVVAAVFGVRGEPDRPLTATLAALLRPKQLLLVLDNCEHLIAACAVLADRLLRACPHLHLLATSREALEVAGEQVYRVPSLTTPPAAAATPEELVGQEAVQLFVARARARRADFVLSAGNAAAVAAVCARLDGIPLAIELAAARSGSLAVAEIAARLDDRCGLLSGGPRTALPRQQTLRATLDWSWDLLSAPEQALLAQLSVFAGGYTLAAVEAVCAGDGRADGRADGAVLDRLLRLVDKSLVLVAEEGRRYRLLETVRQYGREKLASRGEDAATQDRHAAYYLHVARQAVSGTGGAERRRWLTRLEEEHENVRAALAWCFAPAAPEGLEGPDAAEAAAPTAPAADRRARRARGVQLAATMGWFWFWRGHRREGQYWLEQALAQSDAAPLVDRAALYQVAGFMVADNGDAERGLAWVATSVTLYEELGDRAGLALALSRLGGAQRLHADYAAGTVLLDRALALARELADPALLGRVLALSAHSADLRHAAERQRTRVAATEAVRLLGPVGDTVRVAGAHWPLGLIALYERAYAAARQAFATYRDGARAAGDTGGVAVALTLLGDVARVEGALPAARPCYQESRALWRATGAYAVWQAHVLGGLGDVALAAGDRVQAHAHFMESVATAHAAGAGALGQMARALEGLGRLAAVQGQPDRAARLGGAAEALRARAGPPRPRDPETHLAALLPPARVLLDAERHAAAWAEGQTLTVEEAMASALEEPAPDRAARPPDA